MRAGMLLLLGLLLTGSSFGREWRLYDTPATGAPYYGGTELAYDDGAFERWGAAPGWATEEQVGFAMPGGNPWQIMAVRLWIGGQLPHTLILRQPTGSVSDPPGPILHSSTLFTPGYSAEPSGPDRWVEVNISDLDLVMEGGEIIFVGTALDAFDDGLGLDASGPTGHAWGYCDGQWEDDTGVWGVDPGIRLVLSGVLVPRYGDTWGSIKGLFR